MVPFFLTPGNKTIQSYESATSMHSFTHFKKLITKFKKLNSSSLTPYDWDPNMIQDTKNSI